MRPKTTTGIHSIPSQRTPRRPITLKISDDRTEFLISDRLSFMRFLGLGKGTMDLCIRTIGIVRAKVKIGLAHLTYNIRHLVYHERHAPAA